MLSPKSQPSRATLNSASLRLALHTLADQARAVAQLLTPQGLPEPFAPLLDVLLTAAIALAATTFLRALHEDFSSTDKILEKVAAPAGAPEPPEGLGKSDLRYITVRSHVEL